MVPLQGASDRFGEASPWCSECMVFVMLLLYITFLSCDADRSQDDSGERRAIKTCRLATLDVNVRHTGANKPLAETCPWFFCRGSFPQKLIQAHGLHNFQDLQKGSCVCVSRSFQGFACTEAPCADGCCKSSAVSSWGGADAASSRREREATQEKSEMMLRLVKFQKLLWLVCKIWSCCFRML